VRALSHPISIYVEAEWLREEKKRLRDTTVSKEESTVEED